VPTAVRAESRWTAGREDGTDHRRVAVVQMAVEAVVPEKPVPLPGAQTLVVACAPAAMAADAVRRASLASSDAVGYRQGAAIDREQSAQEPVQSLVRRASPWPPGALVVGRCAAVSPADAWRVQADAPAVVSCLVPRCGAGSSAERTAHLAVAVLAPVLRRQVQGALRPSLRQPVVLRLEALRERSRLGVLHRVQQEAVVRPRQRVTAPRRQPELQQVRVRRLAAAVEQAQPVRRPRRRAHAA
jgi:hypothetical protein